MECNLFILEYEPFGLCELFKKIARSEGNDKLFFYP